jgi:hypothetical protein
MRAVSVSRDVAGVASWRVQCATGVEASTAVPLNTRVLSWCLCALVRFCCVVAAKVKTFDGPADCFMQALRTEGACLPVPALARVQCAVHDLCCMHRAPVSSCAVAFMHARARATARVRFDPHIHFDAPVPGPVHSHDVASADPLHVCVSLSRSVTVSLRLCVDMSLCHCVCGRVPASLSVLRPCGVLCGHHQASRVSIGGCRCH